MSVLRPGQTSAVAGAAAELDSDQGPVTHPEGHVEVQEAPVAIPPITRQDASAVEAAQMQQRPQLQQKGHDATAGFPHATATTAVTGTASTARHILTSTLDLPLTTVTPMRVAAAEISADTSNVLELSPLPPVSRSQQPATSATPPSAPAAAMAPAMAPAITSCATTTSSSSSGSAMQPGGLLNPFQTRGRAARTIPTASAAGLYSTVRPLLRYPPGFSGTPSYPSQHRIELQQLDDVSHHLSSPDADHHMQQQAWLQQQRQQYREAPYPPRPLAPEPPSPPSPPAAPAPAEWPIEPFNHHQLHPQPTLPGIHPPPPFNRPTTLADRDAARIITALERYRHDMHRLSNCLTCVSAPRSVVLLPCKHLALCAGCAVNMEAAMQHRVQVFDPEGAWVDFSTEGPLPAQAAADIRWNVCPICGAGVERYIAGVQVPAARQVPVGR